MEDKRQQTGEWGERVAERYLRKREGMNVLARRWRHGHGELDLVMRQGTVMVFVEVRVRTGDGDVMATYRSIGRGKWQVLRKTAKAYLWRSRWHPEAVRFDVVGIQRSKAGKFVDLEHWENVGTFGRGFRF